MATQIAFAQGFLDQLNTLPITLLADHVEDPRRFPARPAYTLPKMPTALSKRTTLPPGAERSFTVTLKSARNPPLSMQLPAQPQTVSVADLRAVVAAHTGAALPKVKLLYAKKPVVDSKTLRDLVGDAHVADVELAVMIMGGVAALGKEESSSSSSATAAAAAGAGAAAPTAAGQADAVDNSDTVLQSAEFWADLETFVGSKIKNKKKTAELLAAFKTASAAKK
ncbi:hypothetical protein TD95_002751 [Thielaviopsis punctulata]|uniref:Ubiquitin-like domain-containing protein n=1 Tax=Thielaviopsis punctulata TaxID=72032 RepID=A0A0F4ZAX7_9PEZI|nr:hypothetical protein TD95_002751 [Thielaviopsis punctulata]